VLNRDGPSLLRESVLLLVGNPEPKDSPDPHMKDAMRAVSHPIWYHHLSTEYIT
jgi:hypothetical protein